MTSEIEQQTGSDPAEGTVEEMNEWIGRTGDTCFATQPINRSMIQFYAAMVEDGNPTYWNPSFATDHWGGICSPPGMLITWKMTPLWSPEPQPTTGGDVSSGDVPLPGEKNSNIMTKTRTKVHRQLREGTWLNWHTEIEDVSEEKETHLGPGHFIKSKTVFRNEQGDLLAEDINHLLRYSDSSEGSADADDGFATPQIEGRRIVDVDEDQGPDDRFSSVRIGDVSEGDTVSGFEFPVTYRKVIHDAAATRDFYPVHHDPDFARTSGTETIFLNTMALQGLVDRLALEWAGPEWRIADRTISMRGSALAGQKLTVQATIEDVSPTEGRIEMDVDITHDGDDVCPSSVTIARGEE